MKKSLILVALLACTLPLTTFAQEISLPITFTTGASSATLTIGTHPNATDDFDTDIDVFAPPAPPANALTVWSTVNNENYLSDFRDTTSVEKVFSVAYQSDPGSTIILNWDTALIPTDWTFEIIDSGSGTQFGPLDMASTGSLDLSSAGGLLDTGLTIRMMPEQQTGVSNEHAGELPDGLFLSQNYPNPFSSSTEIAFTIDQTSSVQLAVYDVTGKQVAQLVDNRLAPGDHVISWQPAHLPNGVYFYRLTQGDNLQVRAMLLMK